MRRQSGQQGDGSNIVYETDDRDQKAASDENEIGTDPEHHRRDHIQKNYDHDHHNPTATRNGCGMRASFIGDVQQPQAGLDPKKEPEPSRGQHTR